MFPLYAIVPLLIGGILSLLFGLSFKYQKYAKYSGLAGSLGSSLLSLFLIFGTQISYTFNWFSISSYVVSLAISIQGINQLLLLLIAIISPLIFIYSIGYMDVPSEHSRYYFELSLFAASMILFAMSGDFITMFVAWEGLGITSYLLIGFWYNKDAPPFAARKAITTILLGDISMLAGILLIFSYYHTFIFSLIITQVLAQSTAIPITLTAGLIFILIGAFTKSAQFPFHEWLSDAMEGPTPVSAFLHSSTMVKAGVFLIALLLPLYLGANLNHLILIFGIVTVVIGALNALSSSHIKKILAYSTIEDLGLMFIALGLGALNAAIALFAVQAIYKSLLFMSAGTTMKANDDQTNIYKMQAFGKNRLLFVMALIGALSIAGILPFSGFIGKVAIENAATTSNLAATSNTIVYLVLVIVDFITSLYIFRWLFIPIKNQSENSDRRIKASFKFSKKSMVIPQIILAFLVLAFTFFGWIYIIGPLNWNFSPALIDLIIETVVAVLGTVVAYLLFKKAKVSAFSESSNARQFLSKGFFVNNAYVYVAKIVELIAKGIDTFDYELNRLVNAGGEGTVELGNIMKKVESGYVNLYIAAFAIGLIFVIILLVW
jgi:NADH-quinone oxidoreductase subunit L